MKEVLIYPNMIYDPNDPVSQGKYLVPYDCYEEAKVKKKVGDKVCHTYSAPGSGYVTYEITRIDETGVYGKKLEDTLRILEPSDVI